MTTKAQETLDLIKSKLTTFADLHNASGWDNTAGTFFLGLATYEDATGLHGIVYRKYPPGSKFVGGVYDTFTINSLGLIVKAPNEMKAAAPHKCTAQPW